MPAPFPTWRPALQMPALRAEAVHLWQATLRPPEMEACAELSRSEWVRAGRFRLQRDRDRYLSGRIFIRTILGRYLGLPPGALRFSLGPYGKPYLDGIDSALRFNLSHSENLLLLAIASAREVGVDVESMRPDVPFADLARYYFGPQLADEIEILPAGQKAQRFYEIWTAAEARLKAAGVGLGGELSECWQARNFTPTEGFAAALATEGEAFELECWTLPP